MVAIAVPFAFGSWIERSANLIFRLERDDNLLRNLVQVVWHAYSRPFPPFERTKECRDSKPKSSQARRGHEARGLTSRHQEGSII